MKLLELKAVNNWLVRKEGRSTFYFLPVARHPLTDEFFGYWVEGFDTMGDGYLDTGYPKLTTPAGQEYHEWEFMVFEKRKVKVK